MHFRRKKVEQNPKWKFQNYLYTMQQITMLLLFLSINYSFIRIREIFRDSSFDGLSGDWVQDKNRPMWRKGCGVKIRIKTCTRLIWNKEEDRQREKNFQKERNWQRKKATKRKRDKEKNCQIEEPTNRERWRKPGTQTKSKRKISLV